MTRSDSILQRGKVNLRSLAVSCALVIASLFLHCDESLPSRDDPQNFLAASVSRPIGPVTVFVPDVIYGGAIRIEVANLLDEVLEADSSIYVAVEMWPKGFPDRVAHVTAGWADLLSPEIVHGGLVTLRPDSAAVFVKLWSQRTDDGAAMWDFGTFRREYTANGTPYCADSVHIVARASVKLFKHVAPVETPETDLVFVYHVFGVDC